ncbi:DUF3592 domain-containing protein [Enemella evansiae]|uniref:DUF3592 domain-containing protein n=1 Tax=Enemella evansiae TaxID=2016499 RepID=UPI000B95F468|nr:DUF3592 domain-containing protein [Enemella evansiae]OYO20452.1 hypothetical protein BI335_02635 [Enemella evansiae]TDO92966.1 uncharacterized protein DUF3592 [Enemella evansiae]
MLWKWGFRALTGLMILLLVGTAVVGGWLAWSDAKADWREADATVIEVTSTKVGYGGRGAPSYDRYQLRYQAVLEFTDDRGRSHQVRDPTTTTGYLEHDVGDSVPIRYDADDPQVVSASSREGDGWVPTWRFWALFTAGLVVVFGGCAWLFGFLAGDWRWPFRAGTGLRR